MKTGKILALFYCMAAFFIAHCSNAPTRHTSSSEGKTQFIFAFDREGEIEPCGCSVNPRGGLVREKNYLSGLPNDSEVWQLTGGITFVPTSNFETKKKKNYIGKAQFLAKGLQTLGSLAVSPSVEDTFLGLDTLQTLQTTTGIPFVATNLKSRNPKTPVFQEYAILKRTGIEVAVLSVSEPRIREIKPDKNLQILPAVKSITTTLKKIPANPNRTWILFASTSEKTLEAIKKQFPQFQILVTNSPNRNFGYTQDTPAQVSIQPGNMGRTLSQLTLQWRSPFTAFYSADWSNGQTNENNFLEAKLKRLTDELNDPHTLGSQKFALQESKERLIRRLNEQRKIPVTAAPELTTYDFQIISLSDDLAAPDNALTQLIEDYKKTTRQLALDEDK